MSIIVLASAALTGFASGLLGVGGAIVFIPMMLFLPGAVGLEPFAVPAVTGLSAIAVVASSLTAGLGHRRAGALDHRLIMVVGGPMLVAATIGGAASVLVPALAILAVFATMATIATILLISNASDYAGVTMSGATRGWLSPMIGCAVGFAAGLVGAGGAFLLIPSLTRLVRVPLRAAIGSSLWIALVGTSASAAAKTVTGQVPWELVPVLVLGIVLGVLVGVRVSHRTPERRLHLVLVIVVIVISVRSWMAVLNLLG